MTAHRILAVIGLSIGLAALALQTWLTIPLRIANGGSPGGAVIFLLSFFTVLTNIGLVCAYAAALIPSLPLGWFRRPPIRAMLAALITVVMAVYHLVLAGIWAPVGLFRLADVALHYVTPITYVLWWLLAPRSCALRMADLPTMLWPPLVYLVWALGRGLAVGEYPYPFLNLDVLGLAAVAVNVVVILLGSLALFAAAILVDQRLARA